jgi:hypothetical protein
MFNRPKFRITYTHLAVTAAVVLAASGAAVAAIPDSQGVIHACYGPAGFLQVIDSTNQCTKGTHALNWQQNGTPLPPADTWHNVGDKGEPPYYQSGDPNCTLPAWHSGGDGAHNTGVGFIRDQLGFVHLRGVAVGGSDTYVGYHTCPIFYLPPGYRPQFNAFHPEIYNLATGRFPRTLVLIRPGTGDTTGTLAGDVELYGLEEVNADAHGILALDGITFRCYPSGVDGCP